MKAFPYLNCSKGQLSSDKIFTMAVHCVLRWIVASRSRVLCWINPQLRSFYTLHNDYDSVAWLESQSLCSRCAGVLMIPLDSMCYDTNEDAAATQSVKRPLIDSSPLMRDTRHECRESGTCDLVDRLTVVGFLCRRTPTKAI